VSEQNHCIYEFGPFRLDAQKRLLLREGEIVPLKPKAFDTLLALVEHGGRVVEKDELMRRVWPDTVVEEGNLTFNISSLRKALGDDPRRHEYIVTIPGEGYKFVAGVRAAFDELIVRESRSITIEEGEEISEPNEIGEIAAPGVRAVNSMSGNRQAETALATMTPNVVPAASRERHRSTKPLMIAALLVVGVITLLSLYWFIIHRQSGARTVAAIPFREMEIARLTTSGKTTHAAISPNGKYVAHVIEDAEGDSLWIRNVASPTQVRIAGPATTEFAWVGFAPDGDSVYYVVLDRDKGDPVLYRVPVLGGPSSLIIYDSAAVGFSPDHKQMAFLKGFRSESRLIIANADGTNERALAVRRQPNFFGIVWTAPAWSPDGKTIACPIIFADENGRFETVVGVSVADGSQVALTPKRWNSVGQPVWLADGSGVLVTASENGTGPAQVWHVSLKTGEATRVTHDLNDYHDLSLTADSGRLAAVQFNSVSSIWVAPEGDVSRAKQIASEVGWANEIAWTPDGHIVYSSNAGGSGDIWIVGADGSNPKQLTTGAHASHGLTVSPDGRYIYFAADHEGRFNLWRMNSDGQELKQLTFGDGELYPHCTPDGAWIVYQRREIEPKLWRVPASGGEPMQLTETRAVRPAVSPDGQMIAYHYLDPDLEGSRWGIGIVSSAGGQRLKRFDFPPTVARFQRFVRWSPDGQSIAFANTPNGLSDIWLQPLDGGPPKQLTNFKAEQIRTFDWSHDGRSLAVVRGSETSDVVLIEQHYK